MRPDPALEGTSGERRHRVLGRLPANLGYEPIAESVAPGGGPQPDALEVALALHARWCGEELVDERLC